MNRLYDSVRTSIAPTATPGTIADDLCHFSLPARSDLGVVFRHGYKAREHTPNGNLSDTALVQVIYVDGAQSGKRYLTEQQAQFLQLELKKQFKRDRIVNTLELPDQPVS